MNKVSEEMRVIIGVDVSKTKLDVAWIREIESGKVKTKVFGNTKPEFNALLSWVGKNTGAEVHQMRFVMEATGVYHEALAHHLHAAGAQVAVVNPAKTRHHARSFGTRSKTDKKDSVTIASYGMTHKLTVWQPEPAEVRELKALLLRLEAIEKDIQRELNRLEKAQISASSAEVIASIESMLVQLKQEKQRLENLIKQHIDQNPNLKKDVSLLETIPAIGPVLSRMMTSLIRSRDFESASQCAAYAGLVPIENESGSSIRGKTVLSKAGDARIRAKLYMGAVAAIKHNPDVRRLYERLLKKGKAKMLALGAAMRKLVHICFGVLKHQTPYREQAA